MALAKQVFDLPLVGGMDEKTDPRLAVRPRRLLNCYYKKLGSLTKRVGSQCLTADGKQNHFTFAAPSTQQRLFGVCNPKVCTLTSHLGRLLRLNQGELTVPLSADESLATQGLQPIDSLSTHYVERNGVGAGAITDLQVAAVGDVVWIAYVDMSNGGATGDLFVERRDALTLALEWREHVAFANLSSKPSLVAYTSGGLRCALVMWRDNVAPNNVIGRHYNEFMSGSPSPVNITLMTGLTPAGLFDAVTDGTGFLWVAGIQAAGNPVLVNRFALSGGSVTPSGSASAALPAGVATDCDGVGIAHDALNARLSVWASQVTAGTRRASAYYFGPAPVFQTGPHTLYNAATTTHFAGVISAPYGAGGNTAWLYSIQNPTGLGHEIRWRILDGAGVDLGAGERKAFFGLSIWSRPWQDASGSIYFYAYQTSGFSGDFVSYYVLRFSPKWEMVNVGLSPQPTVGSWDQGPSEVTAIVAPGQVQQGMITPGQTYGRTPYKPVSVAPRAVPRIESPAFPVAVAQAWLAGILVGAILAPTIQYSGIAAELASAEEVLSYTYADGPARTLAISGGFLALYDGTYAGEVGWFSPPPAQTMVPATAVGGLLTASGKYTYRFVFSAVDARGNVHRSQVSSDVVVQLASTDTSARIVTWAGAAITRRAASRFAQPSYVEIYRTEANLSVFYLVAAVSLIGMDMGAGILTFTDITSDAALRSRPLLYTTGGNLENQPPPSARFVCTAGNRIFLGGTDDDSLWPSDLLVEGEPPTFNLLLVLPSFAGGRQTGLAAMDAVVVIFKRASIWAFTASDGPADNGTGAFSPMTQVATDVGCIDARSITLVPEGLLFLSEAGLCLLGRGLQVVRVAKGVEDTAASTDPGEPPLGLTAGVLLAANEEVRFPLMQQNDPDNARQQTAIVMDRTSGAQATEWSTYAWPTWDLPSGLRVCGATMHAGRYTWIADNGHVFYDDPTTFMDHYDGLSPAWVPFDAWLAPWKPGTVQGFARVWYVGLLGHYGGDGGAPHDLTIELRHNYNFDAPDTSRTWTATELSQLDREQVRVHVVKQKCEAIAVRITDGPPDGLVVGSGEGPGVAGVSLEIGMRSGLVRRPAEARK